MHPALAPWELLLVRGDPERGRDVRSLTGRKDVPPPFRSFLACRWPPGLPTGRSGSDAVALRRVLVKIDTATPADKRKDWLHG
jgi:hypothetical protein